MQKFQGVVKYDTIETWTVEVHALYFTYMQLDCLLLCLNLRLGSFVVVFRTPLDQVPCYGLLQEFVSVVFDTSERNCAVSLWSEWNTAEEGHWEALQERDTEFWLENILQMATWNIKKETEK
jgi:hypothetical protein